MTTTPGGATAVEAATATALPGGPAPEGDPDTTGAPGPRYEPMSLRVPVTIVLGMAVLILIAGVVASILVTGSNPAYQLRSVKLSNGTVVPLTPATKTLHGIVSDEEPPADILGNLGVPTAATVVSISNFDQGAAQFDRTVFLRIGLDQSQTLQANRRMLKDVGWQIIYQGAAPQTAGATEVLAKRGSGDGFYWETGVVVSPTTSAGITPFSIELLQTPDGN